MKTSSNLLILLSAIVIPLSVFLYLNVSSIQTNMDQLKRQQCLDKIRQIHSIMMHHQQLQISDRQYMGQLSSFSIRQECLENLEDDQSHILRNVDEESRRILKQILKQKIQDLKTQRLSQSINTQFQRNIRKISDEKNQYIMDSSTSNYKNQNRFLQVQIIQENQKDQVITTTTQNQRSQTSTGISNGKTVTQSTLDSNTNTQAANNDNYNLNVNTQAPITSIPSTGIDLSKFGFAIPNLSGGVFTQTVTDTSRTSNTQTLVTQRTITNKRNNQTDNSTTSIGNQTNRTTTNNQTTTKNQTTYTTARPEQPQSFSKQANVTVESKKTQNTEFSGIVFYHPIPDHFFLGQLFNFRGRTTKNFASNAKIPINIIFRRTKSSQTFSCSQMLQPGVKQFVFDCEIQKTGDFYLSAFAGSSGQATNKVRKVLTTIDRTIPQTDKPAKPTGLSYEFNDNELTFKWDSRQPITKITFSQNDALKDFIFSNHKNQLKIDFKQFVDFKANTKTIFSIQQASSLSGSIQKRNSQFSEQSSLQFIALQHQFSEQDQSLKISQIPWIISKNTELQIRGRSSLPLKNQFLLLNPSNQFEQYLFINNQNVKQVPANLQIMKKIELNMDGNYLLQINSNEGKAVLNRPIYVYTQNQTNKLPGIPLIPDFQSLKPQVSSVSQILREQPKTQNQKQKLMLDLINQKRRQFGVQQVVLDTKLTQLAQNYATDMVRRGYTGHFNPEGEGPGQRAKKAGIFTNIGQNLAMNPNITDSHYRLARSSIHLRVMTDPQWTRVGLGFAQYSSGSYRIVQQFSVQEMDLKNVPQSQLESIRKKIVDDLIQRYPKVRNQNLKLTNTLKNWHRSNQPKTLAETLKANGFRSYSYSTVRINYSDKIGQTITERQLFKQNSGTKTQVGASIKILQDGKAQVYVVFL